MSARVTDRQSSVGVTEREWRKGLEVIQRRERERLNGGSEEREKKRRGAGREEDGVKETEAVKKKIKEKKQEEERARNIHSLAI